MYYVIQATDKTDSLELRLATRPAHLEYLRSHMHRLVSAGPVLDAEGKPRGSVLIITAVSQEEAEALAAGDPYVSAGLFAHSTVKPFRMVFKDGEEIV
jgi:uncharacterized protein YciI